MTITYAGVDYEIPASVDDLDGEFLRFAADQDAYRMTAAVLSNEQFAAFRKTKPKVRDYNEIGEQIAKTYGFDNAGE